jgi:hypothetical protein
VVSAAATAAGQRVTTSRCFPVQTLEADFDKSAARALKGMLAKIEYNLQIVHDGLAGSVLSLPYCLIAFVA